MCRFAEVDTPYFARTTGSTSKLSTHRDGARTLRGNGQPVQERAPRRPFGIAAAALALVAIAIPVFITFRKTGFVPLSSELPGAA